MTTFDRESEEHTTVYAIIIITHSCSETAYLAPVVLWMNTVFTHVTYVHRKH